MEFFLSVLLEPVIFLTSYFVLPPPYFTLEYVVKIVHKALR